MWTVEDPRGQQPLASWTSSPRTSSLPGRSPTRPKLVGIRPRTAKRDFADLRAKSGLSTEQLIYVGRAAGWLVIQSLEPQRTDAVPRS